MRHILITGRIGVGKSTLIRSLLREIPVPVCGMITKKKPPDRTASVLFISIPTENRNTLTTLTASDSAVKERALLFRTRSTGLPERCIIRLTA